MSIPGLWCGDVLARSSVLVAIALLVTACAAAPPDRMARAGLRSQASPGPSRKEPAADCAKLQYKVTAAIERMKALAIRAKTEERNLPPTMSQMLGRMLGGSDSGYPARAELKRERSLAEAANADLKARGCPEVDIEAALATEPPKGAAAPSAAKPVAPATAMPRTGR